MEKIIDDHVFKSLGTNLSSYIRKKYDEKNMRDCYFTLCELLLYVPGEMSYINEILAALNDTVFLCGAGPGFVIGSLNKINSKNLKVVEIYLNFYFYFFKRYDVDNYSMKIALWLDSNLSVGEYNYVVSNLGESEKECLVKSLSKYKLVNNTVDKVFVDFSVCDNLIKWTVRNELGNEMIWGYSSNVSYAETDSCRAVRDLVEAVSGCAIVFNV